MTQLPLSVTKDERFDFDDLRIKNFPHQGFRREPCSVEESSQRTERLKRVQDSKKTTEISRGYYLYEYCAPIDRLPCQWEEASILHFSDLHLSLWRPGRLKNLRLLAEVVESKQVDFLVITGDFVNRSHADLNQEALQILNDLPAALKLFVFGNHDYLKGAAPKLQEKLLSIGFKDLTNRHIRCSLYQASLNLYGLGDYREGKVYLPRIGAALAEETAILVMHNPDTMQQGLPDVFDLALSGHLHAGGEMKLGRFDGVEFKKMFGGQGDFNRQKVGWATFSGRLLSYVSPGLTRRIGSINTVQPGAALHYLSGSQLPAIAGLTSKRNNPL